MPAKSSQTSSYASDCVFFNSSFVFSLLKLICPTAVARLVTFCVIYPVYRATLWTFTHIFEKCIKGISPLLTNSYAFTGILFVFAMVWQMASSNHRLPTAISRGELSSSRMAMHQHSLFASAGFRGPDFKVNEPHRSLVSAITTAQNPSDRITVIADRWFGFSDYSEFSETHSNDTINTEFLKAFVSFLTSSPSYVSWPVFLICINKIQCPGSRWRLTNPIQEGFERVSPWLSHNDFISQGPSSEVLPNVVNLTFPTPPSMSMGGNAIGSGASAGGGMAVGEVLILNDGFFAAFAEAAALADGFTVFTEERWGFAYNFELAEGEADDFNSSRHNDNCRLIVMFSGLGGLTRTTLTAFNPAKISLNGQHSKEVVCA